MLHSATLADRIDNRPAVEINRQGVCAGLLCPDDCSLDGTGGQLPSRRRRVQPNAPPVPAQDLLALFDRCELAVAGIVHQHVDAPEMRLGFGDLGRAVH